VQLLCRMSGQLQPLVVMAGLVPAIHAFLYFQDVDARHKAGHDGERPYHSNRTRP